MLGSLFPDACGVRVKDRCRSRTHCFRFRVEAEPTVLGSGWGM